MNLLFIMSDDVGCEQHSGYNGTPYDGTPSDQPSMPNVDSLRTDGLRCTRYYSTPLCSPTRVQVLTGRYTARTGIGRVIGATQEINPMLEAEVSFPKLLKRAGLTHQCGLIGKHHIYNSGNGGFDAPRRMGWDYSSGPQENLTGSQSYYAHFWVVQGQRVIRTTYAATAQVNDAIQFIRSVPAGEEWVLFLWFNSAHAPYNPAPTPLHTGTFDPLIGQWEAYKTILEAMDQELGRLFSILDFTDTTVVYSSDNGTPHNIVDSETSPTKGAFPTGIAKGFCFEPGIRIPLYIKGAAVGGSVPRDVTHLLQAVDIYPTFAEMLGITDVTDHMPDDRVIDGRSFMHLVDGSSSASVRDYVLSETFDVDTDQPNDPNQGTSPGRRAFLGTRYKMIRGMVTSTAWESLDDAGFFDLQALDPSASWETDPAANLLGPGGDTSSLSASELVAYEDLQEQAAAIFDSIDLDWTLQGT